MKTMKSRLLLSLCLLTANAGWAQKPELDPIVVTASRIEENAGSSTRKVRVMTAADIAASGARDLSDVVGRLSAVNMSDYGGPGTVKNMRLRGSSSAQVLVLVDGRAINSPRDGSVDLTNVPLDNIDRVEMMYGPASSLYGSQAMGGTLHIITKRPPENASRTQVSTAYGTFGTNQNRLSHGRRFSQWGYTLGAAYNAAQGARNNSAFYGKDINGGVEYTPAKNHRLAVTLASHRNGAGVPGSADAPDADDKQRSVRRAADVSWSGKINDALGFSAKAYGDLDRLEFRENSAGSVFDVPETVNKHTTRSRGANLQAHRRFGGAAQVIAGGNFVRNELDSTSSQYHHNTVQAGYLENQLEIQNKFKLSAGARLDHTSTSGTELNPSASALFWLNERTKIRGAVSRSFRAPTFNDLYWPDEGWAKGNPNLEPEKGVTKEAGVESRVNEYFMTGITVYRNDFKKLINWAPVNSVWQPMNVDAAVIKGVEFENAASWRLLKFKAGYAWQKAVDARSRKTLIYQPRNKADLSIGNKERKGFAGEVRAQYMGARFSDSQNTAKVRQTWVWGLSAAQKFGKGLAFSLAVDNLLGRKYEVMQGYPMPGFAVRSGVKVEF